jgi:transcriptional regulator GlxA family with amidase domain
VIETKSAVPIQVTVLFLDGGHTSTAVGPLEVFRDAGVLWNELAGEPHAPRFRVRTASIDARPCVPRRRTRRSSPCSRRPRSTPLRDSDVVFVSSGGLPIAEVITRNAPIVDFLREVHARGARVAGVCSGVSLLGAAGLLDGRAATSHWALVDELRTRFPRRAGSRTTSSPKRTASTAAAACTRRSTSRSTSSIAWQIATPRASARRRSCSTCRASARPASR